MTVRLRETGARQRLDAVLDFARGSGSLLLNVRHRMVKQGGHLGRIYGQEKNVTTYSLARMNMLLVRGRAEEIRPGAA